MPPLYYRSFQEACRFSISLLLRWSGVQSDVFPLYVSCLYVHYHMQWEEAESLLNLGHDTICCDRKIDGLINSRFGYNSTFCFPLICSILQTNVICSGCDEFLRQDEIAMRHRRERYFREFTFRDERSDRSFQELAIPLICCSNQFRKDFISGRDITPSPCTNGMEHLGQEKSRWFEKPPSEIASASRCSSITAK